MTTPVKTQKNVQHLRIIKHVLWATLKCNRQNVGWWWEKPLFVTTIVYWNSNFHSALHFPSISSCKHHYRHAKLGLKPSSDMNFRQRWPSTSAVSLPVFSHPISSYRLLEFSRFSPWKKDMPHKLSNKVFFFGNDRNILHSVRR